MIKSMIFIRHSEAYNNVMTQDERAASEVPNYAHPITPLGEQQAAWASRFLSNRMDKLPAICFHSTFLRTKMTLETILREFSTHDSSGTTSLIKPIEDSRLDEKWDGIFHELSLKEIEKRYPEQIRLRKRAGWYHYRAPGGENCMDAEIRIKSFLLDPRLDGKDILIVGHGRWAVILQRLLHNLSIEELIKIKKQKFPNCGIIQYNNLDFPGGLPKIINPWEGKISAQKSDFA